MHVMGSVSPADDREVESVAVLCPPSGVSTPPPPPPPPPPPIPPPPPPPLLPGLGNPVGGLTRKKSVRSFFWKTIPEDKVKGRANLWTQGQVQQHQIDVQTIEELFSTNDHQSKAKAMPTSGEKPRSSYGEPKEEVTILDSKRGMNIGIFLRKFKRSNQTIVDDIHHGNGEPYGAEPLRDLLKMMPEKKEVEKLKAYQGDVSKLSLADSFVYLLIQLPSYSVRIESMLLKKEFPGACEVMKQNIKILRSATKELMCCEELHAVLHLVLQAGNLLNSGGYAGNAVGFKLSSLLTLADTKANKPGMNLLHFVALEAQKKDPKLLEFPLKLKHVLPAARISLETLDTDLQCQTSRTRSVEEKVQRDTELLQQLDSFLQSAASTLSVLRVSRQQLKQEGSELMDFFCEDRDTFRLDDCFSIFNIFCFKFTHAVKENMEREVKEAARRRRIQELEEQKRHSWAAAVSEEVGGAFGLRHSSEMNMTAAASRHNDATLLAELLSPKSRMRRSRNSPFSSELIAADRERHKPDAKEAETAFLSASPERRSPGFPETVPTCSFPQNKQPQAGQMSPPKTHFSEQNANRTTATYLSDDATQNGVNTFNPTSKVTVNSTSDSNQQSDHNNNDGEGRLGTLSGNLSGSKGRTNQADQDLSERIEHNASTTTGAMSVVLEKHTLVPELKAFDVVAGRNAIHRRGSHRDDVVIADLEEERADTKVQKNTEKSERRSSSSEEDEGTEENVVVWCVTGVCEADGEHTHADDTHAQTEQDQRRSNNQAGNQQASSAPANRTPSEPQPANEKPVSVPISSQPVPVSRCDDPSRPASSPMWRPAEPSSANDAPALTANQREEADDRSRNETAPCLTTNENTEAVSCTSEKEESSSKTSNHTAKTRNAGMKLAADANECKSVRTLTNSEYQDMRRVVPISRPSRGAPFLGRRPEKPPGLQRAAAAAVSNPSASVRRAQRPSTAPSSRRSSFTKDLTDPKVSAREQDQQDLQRKLSIRKPLVKPRPPPEEKMCRSTLRALSQSGGSGSRTGSAIPIPLQKANSSSSLQGFARSTASSFFRQTHTTLPPRPLSPHPGSDSSSPRVTSSPLTRTASLRVPAASRSADLLNLSSSSSSLTGTQSVRASPRRVPPVLPKGHGRDDGSGVFSDKSARPSWR
ncbi:uncharacterized protein LOC144513255 [Sander vitreus]